MKAVFHTKLHSQRFDFFEWAVDIAIQVFAVEKNVHEFRVRAEIAQAEEQPPALVLDRVFEHEAVDTTVGAAADTLQQLVQHFTLENTGDARPKVVLCMTW